MKNQRNKCSKIFVKDVGMAVPKIREKNRETRAVYMQQDRGL